MRALFVSLLLGLVVPAGAVAQSGTAAEPPGGWITVRRVHGPLEGVELAPTLAELRTLLTVCARARTSEVGLTAEGVDFDLIVAPNGRVRRIELPELDPEERTPSIRRWRGCATRALRRTRFPIAVAQSAIHAQLVWAAGSPADDGHGWQVGPPGSERAGPRGDVVLERFEVPEGVDDAVVRSRVTTRRGAFRACYERAMRADPSIAGIVTLRITLGADGVIEQVVGSGEGSLEPIARCMSEHVQRIRSFPLETPPPETIVVTVRLSQVP